MAASICGRRGSTAASSEGRPVGVDLFTDSFIEEGAAREQLRKRSITQCSIPSSTIIAALFCRNTNVRTPQRFPAGCCADGKYRYSAYPAAPLPVFAD